MARSTLSLTIKEKHLFCSLLFLKKKRMINGDSSSPPPSVLNAVSFYCMYLWIWDENCILFSDSSFSCDAGKNLKVFFSLQEDTPSLTSQARFLTHDETEIRHFNSLAWEEDEPISPCLAPLFLGGKCDSNLPLFSHRFSKNTILIRF